MNKREKELFLKGLEVGMQLAEEYSEKEKPAKVETGGVKEKKKLKRGGKRVAYTEEELELLSDVSLSHEEIAKTLGRDQRAVAQKRYQMGVKVMRTVGAVADDGLAKLGQNE